ncbi:MAG: cytochrome C oxidase subunit IV family protein, partial [Thermodesulfobacteriota bacterium]
MKPDEEIRKTRYKTYVLVWMALVILTGTTFSVAGMELGGWTVLIALAIAGTKSGLVLNYFMHLRSERLLIFK